MNYNLEKESDVKKLEKDLHLLTKKIFADIQEKIIESVTEVYHRQKPFLENTILINGEPKKGERPFIKHVCKTSIEVKEQTEDTVHFNIAGTSEDLLTIKTQSIGTANSPAPEVLQNFGLQSNPVDSKGLSKWYMQPTSGLVHLQIALEQMKIRK